MSNVWAFPPEVNWQADFIKHIVIENIRLRDENARLKDILHEIRDLARTGLKPDTYPTEEIWLQYKINRIASMAHAALEKEVRDE